jgi:nitric oxide reductase subunit B
MEAKKLWISLISVITIAFAVLLIFGKEIYRQAPPIPEKIIDENVNIVFTGEDIKDGQNVWQSLGGHQTGSIWGHGSYVAPDWSADWLHREAIIIANLLSKDNFNKEYLSLIDEEKAVIKTKLQNELRTNRYNSNSRVLTISGLRRKAIEENIKYYSGLFANDPKYKSLREAYSIRDNFITDTFKLKKLSAFFFWTAWACVTDRPNKSISYTHNWPHDELVGNTPTSSLIIWTGFSVIVLIAGIALLVLYYARQSKHELSLSVESKLFISKSVLTPSQKATLKYFWIVTLLILVQIAMGIITAHYGVEGQGLYGFPLANFLPYTISRTWHVQLAIFWIATAWLATGLFYAPAISNYEPKFQRLGVNILFIALIIVVGGSLTGQWFGVMQKLGLINNFWFGHQGYEYIDLGRFWQILLFSGLIIWLLLMARAVLPALKQKSDNRNLLILFTISIIAIAAFYGSGLMWGQRTNLAIVEYWRWWVVHLWVEGFFEVFAAVITAFLFVRLNLVKINTATTAVLFSTIIFLSGGIIGTFHHLYFTGTPTSILALGATFSALEVVPLTLLGFEAYNNYLLVKENNDIKPFKWPILFLIAVTFWNLVGAGIFGFLINPPIALYYMQGLNTTPVHGHTALFGVYGMLGIGLMLFVLRDMNIEKVWNNKLLKISFWSINVGLLLMVLLSLLPIGIMQTIASVDIGLWYARSAEFLYQDSITILKWLRLIGDTIFAFGSVLLAYFIFTLKLK